MTTTLRHFGFRSCFWRPGTVRAGLAMLACVVLAAPAGAQIIPAEPPEEVRDLDIQDLQGERVALDAALVDHNGKEVTLSGVFASGRPVVLQMMYFNCPILCPQAMGDMIDALNDIDLLPGKDFDIVLVSFDPRDTQANAHAQHGIVTTMFDRATTPTMRSGIHVLTGRKDQTRKVAQSVGFPYRYLPKSEEYSHSAAIFVVTPDGVLSRTLTGLKYQPRDLKLAILEAGEGKIGSVFDRITLWCFHFDPDAGGYVLGAFRVMQLAGAITALALGILIAVLFSGERRKRRLAVAGAASPGSTSQQVGSDGVVPVDLPAQGRLSHVSGHAS